MSEKGLKFGKEGGKECISSFNEGMTSVHEITEQMVTSLNTFPLVLIHCDVKVYGDTMMLAIKTGEATYAPIGLIHSYKDIKDLIDCVYLDGEYKLVKPVNVPGFAQMNEGELWKEP